MLYLFSFILYFAKLSAAYPFILKELNSCSYNSSDDDTSFTSQLWRVEQDNVAIYYTLCGYVPNNICGMDVAACLRNKRDNSIDILWKTFHLGNDVKLSLASEHGSRCKSDPSKQYKLKIEFDCFEDMKETHLEIRNDCEFVIHMMNPRKCEPKCTTKVNGQLIDLRPLKRDFFIQSASRNFSITLCGSNQMCSNTDKDISFCEVTDGVSIPLSAFQNEIVVFDVKKNDITIHGSYRKPRSKGKKKIELVIKCNWDRNTNDIVDKTLPKARTNYKFEMESSFGCVKLPPNCVITNGFLIYNLTNLYNRDGYLVSNVPKGNIYLNICGPLRLPQYNPKNNCSRSFSQVCEVNNDNFLNKGSILSKFDIEDDIIKATFISGATCNDPEDSSRQYNTHVELFCSKTEEGPKFVKSEICDTFIHWNTPLVCPSYDKFSCTYIHQEFQNCSIHYQEQFYDLRPLTLNNSNYDIQDTSNSNIVYRLNVCGPVTDCDAPCMKNDMIVMKDLDQNNIRHRIKSLGKMDIMSVINGDVIIKTSSGAYCGEGGDYSSVVIFVCSETELQPKLLNRTECTFHFEWETPHACPKNHVPEKKCIIQNAAKNISLNFAKAKRTYWRVNFSKTYEFDFCQEDFKECLKEKCASFPLEKTLFERNGKTYLELTLQKKCEADTDISTVLLEVTCDDFTNNEHFKMIGIENCTLEMQFVTKLICPEQHVVIDIHEKHENDKYDIPKEEILEKKLENCSVSNHHTGYEFNISNLQLDIPVLHCPLISFDNGKSSVMLTYSNNKTCLGSKQSGTYEYRVLLKCSKVELNNHKKTECSEIYEFEKPEFCKLFETLILDSVKSNTSSTGKIIGIVTGTLLTLFGICVLCFLLYRKYQRNTYTSIYERDSDRALMKLE